MLQTYWSMLSQFSCGWEIKQTVKCSHNNSQEALGVNFHNQDLPQPSRHAKAIREIMIMHHMGITLVLYVPQSVNGITARKNSVLHDVYNM